MKLLEIRTPLTRVEPAVPAMMRRCIFALLALLVLPVIRYGPRPLVMAGASVLTAVLCEIVFGLIRTRLVSVTELSSVVTALTVAMLLPLNAPLWLPCAASAFAVLVAKEPFGSFGRTPFHPAAAGVAFAILCWPDRVFTYFDPSKPYLLPALGDCVFTAAQSPAAVLKDGLKPAVVPLNLLWGNGVGPLGTTAVLVIGACGLYLAASRAARPEAALCFLGSAAVLAALFPRIACSPLTSVKYELLTGSLLFAAVFLVTEPVPAPSTFSGRCIYGALAGAFTMVFRHFGAYEQGVCFALLLADAFIPIIDSATCRVRGWGGAGT